MRALSNKSFSHYQCVEAALPFSAVAQRLQIGGIGMNLMEKHRSIFKTDKPVVGCVHLTALPGTPHYDASVSFKEQVERAKREIKALQEAGFDAIVFANEGDRPYLSKVGPEIIASYTRIVSQTLDTVQIPYGCGVLVDPYAAIAIAKAIEIIFEKFPEHAYWAIIGLIVASPVAILLLNSFGTLNVVSVLTGVAALAAGVVIALKLGEE